MLGSMGFSYGKEYFEDCWYQLSYNKTIGLLHSDDMKVITTERLWQLNELKVLYSVKNESTIYKIRKSKGIGIKVLLPLFSYKA